MALKTITLPVTGCIQCGPEESPMTQGDQVKLILDQEIVDGLPLFIFGIVQSPVQSGQMAHPVTREVVSGTYYIVEYEADDLLGVIPELEHCFVLDLDCVTSAQVIGERVRELEEVVFALEVTATLTSPDPQNVSLASDNLIVTYLDHEEETQILSLPWSPTTTNPGPLTFFIPNAASVTSITFEDEADTTAGYTLSYSSVTAAPPSPLVNPPKKTTVSQASLIFEKGAPSTFTPEFLSSPDFLAMPAGSLLTFEILETAYAEPPVDQSQPFVEGPFGEWVWMKTGLPSGDEVTLVQSPALYIGAAGDPEGVATLSANLDRVTLLKSPSRNLTAGFLPESDDSGGVQWQRKAFEGLRPSQPATATLSPVSSSFETVGDSNGINVDGNEIWYVEQSGDKPVDAGGIISLTQLTKTEILFEIAAFINGGSPVGANVTFESRSPFWDNFTAVADAQRIVITANAIGDPLNNYSLSIVGSNEPSVNFLEWDRASMGDEAERPYNADDFLNAEVFFVDPEYTCFAWAKLDGLDNILEGAFSNGESLDWTPERIGVVTNQVGVWGDSITVGYGADLATETGLTVNNYGIGGEASDEIRDRFLARAQTEEYLIFLMGRNNSNEPGFAYQVLADLEVCIKELSQDQKFLILGVPMGEAEDPSDPLNVKANGFKQIVAGGIERWGRNFVDLNEQMRLFWDYGGYELAASFVQPALNGTVQITLNKTAGILDGPTGTNILPEDIFIGDLGGDESSDVDRYTITSVDSATQITVQLTESNVISPGATVENLRASKPKRIIRRIDLIRSNQGMTPRSLRRDQIHPSVLGDQTISKIITHRLSELYQAKF